MEKKPDRSFLGTGWKFPPTFRKEGYGIDLLSEEEKVANSLYIILSTITGERVMLPTFGCNLEPYVFDTMNQVNTTLMEKLVKEALVLHEPRIIVEDFVTTVFQEAGMIEFKIGYTIISTNTRYNYVYPYYINEATNIETHPSPEILTAAKPLPDEQL